MFLYNILLSLLILLLFMEIFVAADVKTILEKLCNLKSGKIFVTSMEYILLMNVIFHVLSAVICL